MWPPPRFSEYTFSSSVINQARAILNPVPSYNYTTPSKLQNPRNIFGKSAKMLNVFLLTSLNSQVVEVIVGRREVCN